jgi:microcystin-dependent protein
MSYRNTPCDQVTICDVTSSTELHILNGVIAEFAVPCSYVVPIEGTDETELVPIQLVTEGYGDPVLAVDIVPTGLTWAAWIDETDESIIRFALSAQCPDAVTEDITCNIALLITRSTLAHGDRTDAVLRGPLLIEASPIAGAAPDLSDQVTTSAARVSASTTNFDGILSATEDTVQLALDALDDHDHPHTHVFPEPGSAPTGSILMFGGSSAPTGWLICDGTEIERATYADLFAVIGESFGLTGHESTFFLPDFRERTGVGMLTGDTLIGSVGATGGSRNAVVVSHSHSVRRATTDSDDINPLVAVVTGGYNNGAGSTLSAGVSATDRNLPPFVAVNYIIKT